MMKRERSELRVPRSRSPRNVVQTEAQLPAKAFVERKYASWESSIKARTTPKKRDRDATEAALYEAACIEFSNRGYDASTTKAIAVRAGCSEGLIYNYFGGKHGLLMAVLEHVFVPRVVPEALFSNVPEATFEAELRTVFRRLSDSLLGVRRELKIIYHRALTDQEFAEVLASVSPRNALKAFLSQRLSTSFALSTDPDMAAEMILSTAFSLAFVYPMMLHRKDVDLDALTADFIDVLVRGLARETDGPPSDRRIGARTPDTGKRVDRSG